MCTRRSQIREAQCSNSLPLRGAKSKITSSAGKAGQLAARRNRARPRKYTGSIKQDFRGQVRENRNRAKTETANRDRRSEIRRRECRRRKARHQTLRALVRAIR